MIYSHSAVSQSHRHTSEVSCRGQDVFFSVVPIKTGRSQVSLSTNKHSTQNEVCLCDSYRKHRLKKTITNKCFIIGSTKSMFNPWLQLNSTHCECVEFQLLQIDSFIGRVSAQFRLVPLHWQRFCDNDELSRRQLMRTRHPPGG